MSATQWYAAQNGQQIGPMTEADLRQMAASGRLNAADMVWHAGLGQWSPAASVPGLLPAGAIALPPLGAPQSFPGPMNYYAPPPPGQGPPGMGQDAAMRMLLPVGRSGWAIAAGYLGLFSLAVLPAPLALIISIIAIMDIKKHPARHGMGRAIFGLIMGILGTALILFGVVSTAITKH